MTVFALDTSSRAASCALLRDEIILGEFFINTALTHSETMMPMARSLLDNTGLRLKDVDVFAVSVGPGSFTGLRIGISSVKGMAMALGRPCAAVSTLEGLAGNAAAFDGIVIPAMDARRSQVYTAVFRCEQGALTRLEPDGALEIPALGERVADFAPEPVILLGDGAELCNGLLQNLPHMRVIHQNLRHQRAGSVAAVAARMATAGSLCSAEELRPAYLRMPQAERERLARLQR